ncbi:MAG: transcriptional regulator [Rhizobacter sp.]|nr:transcriptional regulator [Rhizobacter sp.]
MDKRFKDVDEDLASTLRQKLYQDVAAGAITIGQAVRVMRRISHLTQPEFAKHRGISVQALKQIEQGSGNPTVQTLDKVASIFGLRVGFVPIRREPG